MSFIHLRKPSHARKVGVFLVALGLLLSPRPAAAQLPGSNLPAPRLFTVFPSGAKAGTTLDVTFGGQDLDEPEGVVFSHPGIKAEPILAPEPKPDPKKKPPMPPAKRAVTGFKVTVAADVPIGQYDVRLTNKWGVSNPRAFVVGDLPEVNEKEPNNDQPQAQRIELNSTVNGNMANPTDVDYYVFAGKKGQRVVFSCLASSIDSRLTPGLEIYDANNRPLAENRNYKGQDALADCILPDDGDYYVRLFQFTHTTGNQEYFYRLTVSTAPWIDAVFPPVLEPGKATKVTVYGRNLPGGQPDPTAKVGDSVLEKITATITPPAGETALRSIAFGGQVTPAMSALDGFEYRLKNATGASNPYFLAFARAPVVLDNGNNDSAEMAQEITVPCEIAGRIEKRRDRDWYTFTAKKGDVYNFELFGDRLGSPGDLYFILRNATNKKAVSNMVEMDDNPDVLSPMFFARTDDPATYRFTAPADGQYQLMIGSRTSSILYGPRNLYNMRITPDQPDFRLVVLGSDGGRPGACNLGQGGNEILRVLVWRQDGFNGDIALSVDGLPKGVACQPQTLGAGLRHTVMVLSAAADAPSWTGAVKVTGTAEIGGKKVVREARPGSILWPVQPQSNLPRAARVDRSLALAVRDKAPYSLSAAIDKAEVLQGDKAVITIKATRHWPDFKGNLALSAIPQTQGAPLYLPQNLAITQGNLNNGQAEAKLNVNVNGNTPPGTYNIVVRSQTQIPFQRNPAVKNKQNLIVVQFATPVSLTVIPKSLATLTAQAPQPNFKIGMETKVQVRVNRQYGYNGPFKVQLIIPPNVKGLIADEVTIPAGQNEATLIVKADANAAPGGRGNLIVQATATWGKTTVLHKAQPLNLNVTK
jgi:hypothetical protein